MPSHYNTGEDYLDHEKKKKKRKARPAFDKTGYSFLKKPSFEMKRNKKKK